MDKKTVSQKPPVDIEQWVDFILASASHRSHDAGQQKFGELLINQYFVELRKEYAGDQVAVHYLDNILCAVASAMRALSVARDIFQTNWDGIRQAKEREKARADRLDSFSPFKKDGYWKQAMGVIASLGLLSVIFSAFQFQIGQLPWKVAVGLAFSVVVSLFAMELFVDWLRNRRIAEYEKKYPGHVMDEWRERTLRSYHIICLQFIIQAIKIREEFYPELTTLNGERLYNKYGFPHIDFLNEKNKPELGINDDIKTYLENIVEQHFAFKPKFRPK